MAVTRQGPTYLLQGYAAGTCPTRLPDPHRPGEYLRISPFFYDQEETAETDLTIELLLLPAGRIEVFPTLSRLKADDMVATAVISLGHAAYEDPDLSPISGTVSANLTKWASALDVGGGAIDAAFVGTDPQLFNSLAGVLVKALIATANIDLDDEVQGWVAWRYQN